MRDGRAAPRARGFNRRTRSSPNSSSIPSILPAASVSVCFFVDICFSQLLLAISYLKAQTFIRRLSSTSASAAVLDVNFNARRMKITELLALSFCLETRDTVKVFNYFGLDYTAIMAG